MTDGKTLVEEAYPDLFVSFTEDVDEDGVDFEFELERDLDDDEWYDMPESLAIYDVTGAVFRGAYK